MSAFEIERIDPSKLNSSVYYTAAYSGNAVPAIRPQVVEEPEHAVREAPAPRPRVKTRIGAPLP